MFVRKLCLKNALKLKQKTIEKLKWVLPALHLDVRNGIEVSGQIILIHHSGASGWLQQPNPQISDGEEVPQVLGGIQLAVQ